MGDPGLNAFDVLDRINREFGDDLPVNWLSSVCALPSIAVIVPRSNLSRDLFRDFDGFMLQGLDPAAKERILQGAIGRLLFATVQACRAYDVDLGAALMGEIARQIEEAGQ
jgi:hypothetical protein